MEKKVTASFSESRGGKQDVSPNAKFPRGNSGGRRRESSVAKADQQPPKSWPQKQVAGDKRFQARVYGDRNWSRVASSEDAEIGSAFRPGSKKVNLTHLLNFNYGHRDHDGRGSTGSWSGAGQANRNRSMWSTRKHKYNKELFLQANCQFVVQEGHDYVVYSVDPDLLVDWNWIEQVNVYNHELPSCPICLFPPVAAKMTRCGHVYCWPCLLHYLALSDDSWRKCPICYEAVHKGDLKSVLAFETPCFNVGEEITMKLMYRERNSVIALPRVHGSTDSTATGSQPFLLSDRANVHYAKLLMATREEVLCEILGREERELAVALDVSSHCPEVCFVEAAIELLAERKTLLTENMDHVRVKTRGETKIVPIPVEIAPNETIDSGKMVTDEIGVDMSNSIEVLSLAESSEVASQRTNSETPTKNGFYFYQASDGQHIYLHNLNVHMLTSEYGSLDRCPDTVTAHIVEKEDITMNSELRRRLRCLGHLPLTCEFQVVELRLDTPLVSKKTMDDYEEEIDKRRRRRNRRVRDDNRRQRKYHAEEDRRMGRGGPENHFRLEDNSFPEWSNCVSAEGVAVASGENAEVDDVLSVSPVGSTKSAVSGTFGSPEDWGSSGRSFAQMLRTGKVRPDAIERRQEVDIAANPRRARGRYDSDSDSEEALHSVPSYQDSFSAALQIAFDKKAAAASSNGGAGEELRVGGNSKKKGKQKRLLFTTGGIRHK